MEPQHEPQADGLAPKVGWSSLSPSLLGTPNKTPSSIGILNKILESSEKENYQDSTMISLKAESLNSSGIEGDFTQDYLDNTTPLYSPAISSCASSEFFNNNNTVTNKKNSSLKLTNSNPNYDGVKFDLDDKDSIMSSDIGDLNDDDDNQSEKNPKIPDGGWGWMVVLGSLIISMIADGISFSFGLLYIEFLHEYGASKSKTAWIGSFFMAVPLISGPIMSALVDRYGCRSMTILGGLISGTGFVLSSLSNTIELQFITFGLIAGLGLGLCYVTAVVAIAYWFDKQRTFATGLGACGTGIGTFVYAPLTQYLIEEFGWRGTVLLLAGTFFNMCVCGALMRSPDWWIREQERQASLAGKSIRGASSCGSISGARSMGAESNFPGVEEIRKLLKNGETPEYILTTLATSIATDQQPQINDVNNATGTYRSVINLPTFVKQSEKVPIEVLETLSSNKRLYNIILENYPSLLLCRSCSDKGLNKITESNVPVRVPVTMSMRLKQSKREKKVDNETGVDISSPLLFTEKKSEIIKTKSVLKKQHEMSPTTPAVFETSPWLKWPFSHHQTNYLKDIKMHRNSLMYRGAMLNIRKYRLRASSCPDIYRNSMITLAKNEEEKWYTEFIELLKEMVDFSMFLELHFLMLSLSTIILYVWFIIPYFYLAEHLTHHGYSENYASKLISVIGVANTIGIVALGWAGDQPWMNVQKTYCFCLIVCGIATIGIPIFSDNSILLTIICSIFGLFFASSFSFTPAILVQLIPFERFTTAYGLTLLCQGIGNLLGPPLAGMVFDITKTWDLSFYLSGFWIIISGVLIAIIPATQNRKIWGSGQLEMDIDRDSMV